MRGSLVEEVGSLDKIEYKPVKKVEQNVGLEGRLDLSFNNFSGELSNSFSSLSNLSSLYLQNNQLTGSVNVLSDLPLTELNIANNHFSGWISPNISSIPNFRYEGNSFDNGPAPPLPLYTSPPPSNSHNDDLTGSNKNETQGSQSDHQSNNGLKAGHIVGIALGSIFVVLCVALALVFCLRKLTKGKNENGMGARTLTTLPVVDAKALVKSFDSLRDVPLIIVGGSTEMQNQSIRSTTSVTDMKSLPAENLIGERVRMNSSGRRPKAPITATPHTVASLQIATNNFSQESLVGEGSLGRVYRAEYPNGKILAIKKIDSAAASLQEEDNFLEAVSNMSRLRHPNIVTLVGYCAEHGQRLLVYEYIGGGTLHDALHFNEYSSKPLTWNARVRVALGSARALEHLHEVCLPSVVHRNFKSANILLDEELNPHLSDCAFAALTPNAERPVSTQMVGAFGYSAPEYAMSGIYTVKSDVYSFGVVMLELLTGRKPLDSSRIRSEQSLVRWATPQLHDIDSLAKMVDRSLNGMYPAKSLSRFADIIAQCIQPEPEFRPPMSEVVEALVRLMQRASVVKRSNDESGFTFRVPDQEILDTAF
ncbi:hypothetical protein IFM89_004014 [Coptis chinensis]|uniref:Protein kinase domain-containing protein n=1 Tax=Coptis chinensis TaxID=261450 RepID=A0A835GVH1_9MAGN|nr:hypothetical protein IFM89_004014 [Coptis chinensis]